MFIGNRYRFGEVWFWARKNLIQAAGVSTAVYTGHEWLGLKLLSVPFLPVSTIGTAVAFYVGFKNNSSYDRLWEGRRVWGAITNVSRTWAALALSVVREPAANGDTEAARAIAKQLIYRQIAWAGALRIQLRQRPGPHRRAPDDLLHIATVKRLHGEDEVGGDEMDTLLERFSCLQGKARPGNVASALLREQAEQIAQLKREGCIDGWEHGDLMRLVTECYAQQGAAERIKSFPFPRQYALFSNLFVKLFLFLVPFGLMGEMARLGKAGSWLVIPFSVLIAWVFYTMEQVGESSEDPFDGGVNDVPMSAICRNIEIDLREMLGETELPARLQPVENILM